MVALILEPARDPGSKEEKWRMHLTIRSIKFQELYAFKKVSGIIPQTATISP